MNSAELSLEELIITVNAPDVAPQTFFEENAGEIVQSELFNMIIASSNSVNKFIVSEVSGEKEAFIGCNGNYLKDEFQMVARSLSFEEIFKIFPSQKKAKKHVDSIEGESEADFWMLYVLNFDEGKNTMSLVPQGRFKKQL